MTNQAIFFAILVFLSLAHAAPRAGFGPGFQDWGYIDVRPGAHMFYWLYYTTANVARFEDRPLIIWLQGGPGASGTGSGNFDEIGPLDMFTNPRNWTWVRNYNVLFVDSPVDVGFSLIDSPDLLTQTNPEIVADLMSFLRQFLDLNPEFRATPIHIFGQSYGGKVGAEWAYVLDQEIKAGRIDANLISTNFGNSWIHPMNMQEVWASMLYHFGYVDIDGHNRILEITQRTKQACDSGQWVQCRAIHEETRDLVWAETGGYFDFYNMIAPIVPFDETPEFKRTLTELMNGPVKQTLGLNKTWTARNMNVHNAQAGSFMKPVTDIIGRLLDETNIKVGVYVGMLDMACSAPATMKWLNNLSWSGLNGYKSTPKTSVVIDGYIEAYKRFYRNLHVFWINRSGHPAPKDNAKATNYFVKEIAGY